MPVPNQPFRGSPAPGLDGLERHRGGHPLGGADPGLLGNVFGVVGVPQQGPHEGSQVLQVELGRAFRVHAGPEPGGRVE